MPLYNTYTQQLSFNGTTYTMGEFKDLYKDFKIVCQNFPFVKNPEPKEFSSNDWKDEDGLDVYVPKNIKMKHYDVEATFLYKGTESDMRDDISAFIEYLYGRNTGAVGGLLAIYNEYVGMGRKDVVVSKVDNKIFNISESDPDAIAQFDVRFTVYDPITEVGLSRDQTTDTVLGLVF